MSVRPPRPVTIAVDAMSGDRGPDVVVRAVRSRLESHADLEVLLAGPEDRLGECLRDCETDFGSRLRIQHASEVVEMHDSPSEALRKKKDSSMRRALELVQDGQADACVSAGNTGALVAKSRHILKTMPGISRPAIVSAIFFRSSSLASGSVCGRKRK